MSMSDRRDVMSKWGARHCIVSSARLRRTGVRLPFPSQFSKVHVTWHVTEQLLAYYPFSLDILFLA